MKSIFTTTLLFLTSFSFFAQHIKIDKKKLSFLKTEQTISVIFSYKNHTRGGDDISEQEYLERWHKKLHKRKKDTAIWQDAYLDSKNILWQETYVDNLNTHLSQYISPHFVLNSKSKTNYTMVVNVLWIYSGFDIGIASSPSKIKLKLELLNNLTNEVTETIHIKESRGKNRDLDNESAWPDLRLVQNAFKNSAFKLAITLKRVFEKQKK